MIATTAARTAFTDDDAQPFATKMCAAYSAYVEAEVAATVAANPHLTPAQVEELTAVIEMDPSTEVLVQCALGYNDHTPMPGCRHYRPA